MAFEIINLLTYLLLTYIQVRRSLCTFQCSSLLLRRNCRSVLLAIF